MDIRMVGKMIEFRNHFQENRQRRQGGFCDNKNTSCNTKKQKGNAR